MTKSVFRIIRVNRRIHSRVWGTRGWPSDHVLKEKENSTTQQVKSRGDLTYFNNTARLTNSLSPDRILKKYIPDDTAR
jgi:hypothetical protein